jgi:hypothetical protein
MPYCTTLVIESLVSAQGGGSRTLESIVDAPAATPI